MPPKVLVRTENEAEAVSMSGRVVLSCPVVAGDPPPQITWLKNDSLVQLNNRVSQLPNGSLVIYDAAVRIRACFSACCATQVATFLFVSGCVRFGDWPQVGFRKNLVGD